MINPYEMMYDSRMDVYRYQDTTGSDGFDMSGETCVASGIKCRYGISAHSYAGVPVPGVQTSNQLFCGLGTDMREGDKVIVTLISGQQVALRFGEAHPYSFQYQCRVERNGKL